MSKEYKYDLDQRDYTILAGVLTVAFLAAIVRFESWFIENEEWMVVCAIIWLIVVGILFVKSLEED